MSDSMVERVLKAIQREDDPISDGSHSQTFSPPNAREDRQRRMARAAIEAMRDPTEAMICEAMIKPHPSVAEAGGIIEQGRAAVKIDYQAMIDAALSEKP